MKQLISAADIRQAKSDNKTYLVAPVKDFIITPEAREVAKKEGIELLDTAPVAVVELDVTVTETLSPTQRIQDEIEAQLSYVDSAKSAQIQQLIANSMADFNQKLPSSPRQINDDGIVLIRGNAIKLDVFAGAPGKNIGLTDVIGAKEGSNMGVGYMGWENAFFPWTLNYDEVNVVLEGELHVKTASGTTIAKPGEVIFIPKNSTVEFGTPTHVRYVYITYPVEWA